MCVTVGENILRTDSVSGTEKFQLKITFISGRPEVYCRKGVLYNFIKKGLWQR